VQLRELPVMIEGGTRANLHFQMRRSDRHLLEHQGIEYEVLVADIAASRPARSVAREPDYHTVEELSARLRQLAEDNPDIARVLDLGTSWQGRELTGLLVTDQPWSRELDEPSLRIVGTHHGDELASMEVTLAIIETVLGDYAAEPRVTAMVDGSELWFLPIVNPDGVTGYTRRNSRGVDLNRNYSFLWQPGAYSGEQPFSEVETDAIRTLSMNRSFFHGLSLHSGASNLGWVWNNTIEPAADTEWMEQLCQDYLSATSQPEFWVTNGGQWYITYGDTNDWSYGVRGGHDYTLEVSVERSPDPSLIETLVGYHSQPSVDFLLGGFEAGIHGRVTGTNGQPLEAKILPTDPNWPTWSDPETGAFARPLLPGTYQLAVSASGYQEESVSVVVPASGTHSVDVSVELSATTDILVHEARGLEQSVGLSDTVQLCGAGLAEALSNGGRILLDRPGLAGPYELDWQEASGGACLDLDLDPTAISEPWLREGEWHLIAEDSSNQVRAQLPLGLLLVSTEPGYSLQEVTAEGPAESLRIDISGAELPEGAAIRFSGPAGQRRLPTRRLDGDSSERISALVDASDWDDGAWSIRVFGNGHWAALAGALLVSGGEVTVNKNALPPAQPIPRLDGGKGEAPHVDEPPGLPPTDDGAGCACTTTPPVGRPSALLVLVLTLWIGYFRRDPTVAPASVPGPPDSV